MGKRSRGYVIFLCIMGLVALVGGVLLITGGMGHTELPRQFPWTWLMTHRSL